MNREKYFGIRPGPGRKHPDDEINLCPKCGSEMDDYGTRYHCPKCDWDSCFGYEESIGEKRCSTCRWNECCETQFGSEGVIGCQEWEEPRSEGEK